MIITMNQVFVAIFGVAAIAWFVALYYWLAYYREFDQARSTGQIPPSLMRQKMAIGWMMASAGIVPKGERSRRKCTIAVAVFCASLVAIVLLSAFVPH